MMKMTAHDLRGFGIVEGIIPEPNGGAHIDPDAAGLRLRKQIFEAYEDLSARRMDTLLKERSKRILSVGVYFEAQTRQANPLRRFFGRKGWSAARG
jgi:acetyl-CoA carboxylase carboxyl transferase subunit alpha